MNDILRKLYSGQFFPSESVNPKSLKLDENREKMHENHLLIISALEEKYGKKKAEEIDNDFVGSHAYIVSEEMFEIFKEGFYLGFEIVMKGMDRGNHQ